MLQNEGPKISLALVAGIESDAELCNCSDLGKLWKFGNWTAEV